MPGCVAVVLDKHAQQVLLHQREDFCTWALPGGRIEPDESPEQAAIRETHEETGYTIVVERLIGEYQLPQLSGGNVRYACRGRIVGGAPIERGEETLAVRWFPLDALPASLTQLARGYIQDALAVDGEPLRKTQQISPPQLLPYWVALRCLIYFVYSLRAASLQKDIEHDPHDHFRPS